MLELLLVPASSFFNRLRGGGWFKYNKDVAWLYLAAAIYLITQDWLYTLIVILGAFLDFRLSWGWLLNMNRGPDGGEWASPNDKRWQIPYVKWIKKVTNNDDHKGMFLRRLFIAPMFAGMWYFGYLSAELAVALTFVHSLLMVASYEIGARMGDSVKWGEWISGAAFGALLVVPFL